MSEKLKGLRVYEVEGTEYVQGPQKALIPFSSVPAARLMQDGTIRHAVARAHEIQGHMRDFVRDIVLAMARATYAALPEGAPRPSLEQVLSKGGKIATIDGEYKVDWVIDRRIEADHTAISALKAAIEAVLEEADIEPMTDKLLRMILGIDSNRTITADKQRILAAVDIQHPGWPGLKTALQDCFRPAAIVGDVRVYERIETDGEPVYRLIPLRITGISLEELRDEVEIVAG
jgi:hypothetical protein